MRRSTRRRIKRQARAVTKTPAPAIRIVWLDGPRRFLIIYG